MKFIVLAAESYHCFGWQSYKASFKTEGEAWKYVRDRYPKGSKYWWQIVDLNTMEIIGESR